MQRATSVLFGLLLAGAIVVVVLQAGRGESGAVPVALEGGSVMEAATTMQDSGADDAERPEGGAPLQAGEAGVPALPDESPKRVSFGVILFRYEGRERAPKDARSKSEALAMATRLIPEAEKDFEDATKKGDRGSNAEMGHVPRGVLEPRLEYVLFTMKKGEVHPEPIDTPTGYWLLRRNQ